MSDTKKHIFKSHITFNAPKMTDNSDDLIQTVPAPTKEEGADNQVEWKDLDDRDVKDADNTDITIDINDKREQRHIDGDPDKVPSNTVVTGVESVRLWATLEGPDVSYMPNGLRDILLYLGNCDRAIDNYRNHVLGQEGFLGYTKAAITGLGNIIGHILGLFKTGLFYGWRDFKHSEVADWCASNYFSKLRINRIPYEPLKENMVDIPQGMKGKYIDAVNIIEKFLNAADMVTLSNRMVATTRAIWEDLNASNPQMTYFIPVDKKAKTAYFNSDILTIFAESSKIFTTNTKLQEAKFKDVFSSMAEFSDTVEKAIDLDSHLRLVATVHENLEEIEKFITKIVTRKDKINDQQLETLVDMVRAWANYFDCYATVCNDLNRIDHNLTLILHKWKDYLLNQ